MKVFMTNGTLKFLKQLIDQHPKVTFFFMSNKQNTVAYYENSKKGIFAAGREYTAVLKKGSLLESGYVVINNIPIPGESQPIFEDHFKTTLRNLQHVEGCQAFRLLKPKRGDMYAVFTQWRSINDYEKWINSEEFTRVNRQISIKQPAYFGSRSFTNTYSMVLDEDE